ncbi:hypothetical protein GCM10018953_41860 [Streptosporangium nondiastaticum]
MSGASRHGDTGPVRKTEQPRQLPRVRQQARPTAWEGRSSVVAPGHRGESRTEPGASIEDRRCTYGEAGTKAIRRDTRA